MCSMQNLRGITTLILMLSLSMACAGAPSSESDGPIAPEDILSIRQTGAPVWSPAGDQVGFSWGIGTELNFWVADASGTVPQVPGEEGLFQVTALADRGSYAIANDWTQLAYVSKNNIWRIPLDGGLPINLTQNDEEARPSGKYSNLVWSPDGTNIAFTFQHADPDQTDVGVLSTSVGEITWIADGLNDEDSPIWSPDSQQIAYQRRTADWHGYEIWVGNRDGENQRRLVTENYERGVEEFRFDGNHHWSPAGDSIVYLSSRTGYNNLWLISVVTGEPAQLTEGEWVDYSPRWSPSGDRIAFVSSRSGNLEERHIWTVDADGGDPVRISPEGFSRSPAWSRDGNHLAYLQSSATQPREIVVQEATPGSVARRLTESLPDPSLTANFVAPEAIRYPSDDGTLVPAILLRSTNETGGSRPGLLWFHGKGGINLEGWGGLPHYAFHQRLVKQGYSIVFVNWRGTHIGYGTEWERANYRDYAGGELDDVVGAAKFLEREVGVDPDRIGCWGGSYGGYMTMLTITKASEVCSAGVSLYGVSDWTTFLDQSQRKLWNVRLIAKLGEPTENTELYDRSAAIRFVDQVTSPLLILQGQDDDGVVPEQGTSLYEALTDAGKDVDYVAYIGEGHGFRHIGSVRDLYWRVEEFFQRHLIGGR